VIGGKVGTKNCVDVMVCNEKSFYDNNAKASLSINCVAFSVAIILIFLFQFKNGTCNVWYIHTIHTSIMSVAFSSIAAFGYTILLCAPLF